MSAPASRKASAVHPSDQTDGEAIEHWLASAEPSATFVQTQAARIAALKAAMGAQAWERLVASARRGIIGAPFASIGQCFGGTEWDRETLTDFDCPACGERVERKLKILIGTPYVMNFLGCDCPGAVAYISGDPAPTNSRQWRAALEHLRRRKMDVLLLNLNPRDSTGQN